MSTAIRLDTRDRTYSEGCGCKVTEHKSDGSTTYKFLHGPDCTLHKSLGARTDFIAKGRDAILRMPNEDEVASS